MEQAEDVRVNIADDNGVLSMALTVYHPDDRLRIILWGRMKICGAQSIEYQWVELTT